MHHETPVRSLSNAHQSKLLIRQSHQVRHRWDAGGEGGVYPTRYSCAAVQLGRLRNARQKPLVLW